jgi:hypothetical protein
MPYDEIKKEIILLLKASKKGMAWEDLLNDLKLKHKSLERIELEDILREMRPEITKTLKKDERGFFKEYWIIK